MIPAVRSMLPALGCWALSGCQGPPDVPERPTWADVEPILRGSCTHCHGSTAAQTGAALTAGAAYRFDFYDMTEAVCGPAAQALGNQLLARGWAALIKADVTSPGGGWRPRMPPAPAEALLDWERDTLVKWASEPDPAKGEPRRSNGRPEIQLNADSATADQRLKFAAVVWDPDGEAVVSAITVGDLLLTADRAGAFAADVDTAAWAEGRYPITAVLCDGWDSVKYDLGTLTVKHALGKK